jgi:flagellar FliL protein
MAAEDMGAEQAHPGKSRKRLLIIAVPVLLVGTGLGLYVFGLLPTGHKAPASAAQSAAVQPPIFADIPDIVANLNSPGHRSSFVKLHVKLELTTAAGQEKVSEAMPRIQDLFQTFLRETRPDELRGSEGSYRLREELLARVNIAAPEAHVQDVLFTELLVQ